jgi:ABC-type uncharacterized transport system permease subunit
MDGNLLIVVALVVQSMRISLPYVFAALGGTFSERGGVINIALEGILLNSAFVCIATIWYAERLLAPTPGALWIAPWLGVLAAIAGGLVLALVLALATVTFKANQIICGLALNIFAAGFTKFMCQVIFDSPSNSESVATLPHLVIAESGIWAVFGDLLHPLMFLAIVILPLSYVVLYKTPFGLRLRACGENPTAADTVGISVSRFRYLGVLIGGCICGLGGAWLALDQGRFSAGMSAGRGYIALAAMIVGKWHPLGAAMACLLFGFAEALQLWIQSAGVHILPNQFVQMIPYVLTILVLAGFIGRAVPPAADGTPYEKERD